MPTLTLNTFQRGFAASVRMQCRAKAHELKLVGSVTKATLTDYLSLAVPVVSAAGEPRGAPSGKYRKAHILGTPIVQDDDSLARLGTAVLQWRLDA